MVPKKSPALLFGLLCAANGVFAESGYNPALCADLFEKILVREYYDRTAPADPMPIPSRALELIETKIVSALPPDQAIGTQSTPERFAQVWRSIDAWGAHNKIGIVVTVDGWHAFNFPSLVPVTRGKPDEEFYSVFANEGRGVHGHINRDLVEMIYATKLPARDGSYLRTVSFYSAKGDLIAGVYASEGGKPVSGEVVAGFDRTWELIQGMPRTCKKTK